MLAPARDALGGRPAVKRVVAFTAAGAALVVVGLFAVTEYLARQGSPSGPPVELLVPRGVGR